MFHVVEKTKKPPGGSGNNFRNNNNYNDIMGITEENKIEEGNLKKEIIPEMPI